MMGSQIDMNIDSVQSCSHSAVWLSTKRSHVDVCLCSEAVENATGPLLVEIDKPFCCSLGVELVSMIIRDHNIICISNIVPASIADRWISYSLLCISVFVFTCATLC